MTNATSKPATEMTEPKPYAPSAEMVLARQQEEYRLALEPKTFGETMNACELLSQAGIKGCESPPLVLAKVMAGRALGIGFMASVMGIDNIEGSMALRAKLKVALCLKARHVCEYFRCVESTHEKATYVCKRIGGAEKSHTFTVEDAAKASLLDRGATPEAKAKSNWNRWTASMLRARCSGQLADMEFPDVTGGLATHEDLLDNDGDPEEMVGEVVHPVAGAPRRDWAAESKALIARVDEITAETPPAARKPVRDEVTAFVGEAPEPFKGMVGKAYNDTPKYVAPKAAAASTPNGAAPATPPTTPVQGA